MAKIKFNKEACLGCGACTSISGNWVMEGDKAKPKKTTISGKEIQENKDAAAICPVNAIEVVE